MMLLKNVMLKDKTSFYFNCTMIFWVDHIMIINLIFYPYLLIIGLITNYIKTFLIDLSKYNDIGKN